jgi:hypothetical protein
VVVAVLTGWWVAALVLPAAAAGLPVLLSAPPSTARIDRLEAMEEWTRALSGVLTVGVGLEQALLSTLRSTPQAIRPEVTKLVSRLRARWATEDALRAFADDLDDATGDVIAANLILGARRRGPAWPPSWSPWPSPSPPTCAPAGRSRPTGPNRAPPPAGSPSSPSPCWPSWRSPGTTSPPSAPRSGSSS